MGRQQIQSSSCIVTTNTQQIKYSFFALPPLTHCLDIVLKVKALSSSLSSIFDRLSAQPSTTSLGGEIEEGCVMKREDRSPTNFCRSDDAHFHSSCGRLVFFLMPPLSCPPTRLQDKTDYVAENRVRGTNKIALSLSPLHFSSPLHVTPNSQHSPGGQGETESNAGPKHGDIGM